MIHALDAFVSALHELFRDHVDRFQVAELQADPFGRQLHDRIFDPNPLPAPR